MAAWSSGSKVFRKQYRGQRKRQGHGRQGASEWPQQQLEEELEYEVTGLSVLFGNAAKPQYSNGGDLLGADFNVLKKRVSFAGKTPSFDLL